MSQLGQQDTTGILLGQPTKLVLSMSVSLPSAKSSSVATVRWVEVRDMLTKNRFKENKLNI